MPFLRFALLLVVLLCGLQLRADSDSLRVDLVVDTTLYTGKDQAALATKVDNVAVTYEGNPLSSDDYILSITDSAGKSLSSIINVDEYRVMATLKSNSDTAYAPYYIRPAPLYVKPDNLTEIAGSFISSYPYHYQGFVNNEKLADITVLQAPTLTSNATSPLTKGTYTVSVVHPGAISAKNYVLQSNPLTGTLTVNNAYTSVIFSGVPASVPLPATQTASTMVTIGVISADGSTFPDNTHVYLDVSGTGVKNAKLNRTYFDLSKKSSDSMNITIIALDSKPAASLTLSLKLWVKSGTQATAAAGADIALLNAYSAGILNQPRIEFFNSSSKAKSHEAAILRIDNNAATATVNASVKFKVPADVKLYDSKGNAVIDNTITLQANGSVFLLARLTTPYYTPYPFPKRRTISIASAKVTGSQTNFRLGLRTHTISFTNDQPFFAEVPTRTVLTRPTYSPDSFPIAPLPYARTSDNRQFPELLRIGLDTTLTLDSMVSGFGAVVRMSPPDKFHYDFSHLNFTDTHLARGFTDSFPIYLAENGAGTVEGNIYIAYGRPSSTGAKFHITRAEFNTVTGNYTDSIFAKRPSVSGHFYRPFSKMKRNTSREPRRLTLKTLYDKAGPDSVTSTLTQSIRTYNTQNIKHARTFKAGAQYFLDFSVDSPAVQRSGTGLTLKMKSNVEKKKTTAELSTLILSPPVIKEIALAVDSSNPDKPVYALVIRGQRFGLKPGVQIEYKTPAKRPAVKVKKLSPFWSPKKDTAYVTTLDSGIKIALPTAAAFKEQDQADMLLVVKLPAKLPKTDGRRLDLLMDSKSFIGGQKNIHLSLPVTLWKPSTP